MQHRSRRDPRHSRNYAIPNLKQTIDRSLSISRGVATVLERRVREAYSDYATRIRRAQAAYAASAAPAGAAAPQQALRDWWQYNVDFVQR